MTVTTEPIGLPYTQDVIDRVCDVVDDGGGRFRAMEEAGVSEYVAKRIIRAYRSSGAKPVSTVFIDVPNADTPEAAFLKMENAHLRRRLRELERGTAIEERLLQVFREAMPRIQPPKPIAAPKKTTGKAETMVLCLSDWHAGEVVNSEEVMEMNAYDLGIMRQRVESLTRGVLSIRERMAGYEFERCCVFLLGDMVSGFMHDDLLQGVPVCDQVIEASYCMAQVISSLAGVFPQVDVVGVVGNHGRFRKKPYAKLKFDNLDYLAYKMTELMVQGDNISYLFPRAAMAMLGIYGWNFLLRHGDGKSQSYAGIPYYGISRADGRITQAMAYHKELFPHYHVLGHYHQQATLEKPGGKVIMAGSLKGVDEYAWNTTHGVGDAKQKLFSVHPEHGVTWEIDLNI